MDLTNLEKETLRFFVEQIDAGIFEEEFYVFWTMNGTAIGCNSGFLEAPGFSKLTLDNLQAYHLVSWRLLDNDAHSAHCSLKPKARRLVESNFRSESSPIVPEPSQDSREPDEIKTSLAKFKKRYPDPAKVAFIIMRFGNSTVHSEITEAIKAALAKHGITALRADDFEFHPDVFPNILTYMHGCSFGIAVYERIENNDPNPNVALEVGYMLAQRKPVCLLKDKTLNNLPSDIVGKLYRPFDTRDVTDSISKALDPWIGYHVPNEENSLCEEHAEDVLKNEISLLRQLLQDSDLVCPECQAPLAERHSHTVYHGDEDADVTVSEYTCGSSYLDNSVTRPCPHGRVQGGA